MPKAGSANPREECEDIAWRREREGAAHGMGGKHRRAILDRDYYREGACLPKTQQAEAQPILLPRPPRKRRKCFLKSFCACLNLVYNARRGHA